MMRNLPQWVHDEIQRLITMLETKGYKTRVSDFVPTVSGRYESVHYSQYGHSKADFQQPAWHTLRLRLFDAHKNQCQNCTRGRVLHLHHKHYFRRRKAWDYPDGDFAVLCPACHALVHDIRDEAGKYLMFERALSAKQRMALHRDEIERLWEEFRADETEAEIRRAMGEDRDPADYYDSDNAGDWEEEYGADPGDLAEEQWNERNEDRDADDDDYEM